MENMTYQDDTTVHLIAVKRFANVHIMQNRRVRMIRKAVWATFHGFSLTLLVKVNGGLLKSCIHNSSGRGESIRLVAASLSVLHLQT